MLPRSHPSAGPVAVLTLTWLTGMALLLLYSVVSLLRLRRRLVGAVRLEDNIYLADYIPSPFVMGLFRPKIYLPSTLTETERGYILRHEQYHLRRRDHVVKLLSFLALCVHWFNPLVWAAFILAGKGHGNELRRGSGKGTGRGHPGGLLRLPADALPPAAASWRGCPLPSARATPADASGTC